MLVIYYRTNALVLVNGNPIAEFYGGNLYIKVCKNTPIHHIDYPDYVEKIQNYFNVKSSRPCGELKLKIRL